MTVAALLAILVPGAIVLTYYLSDVRAQPSAHTGITLLHTYTYFTAGLLSVRLQVRHRTLFGMVRSEFLAQDNDPSQAYWIYFVYIFLSANWDAILLLVATLTVRWKYLVGPACHGERSSPGADANSGRRRPSVGTYVRPRRRSRRCAPTPASPPRRSR